MGHRLEDGQRAGNFSRRDFLWHLGLLGAGAVVGSGIGCHGLLEERLKEKEKPNEAAERRNEHPGMEYRILGKTGLAVSAISLGNAGLRENVLPAAIDKGINLWQCCIGYSEFDNAAKILRENPALRRRLFIMSGVLKSEGWTHEKHLQALKTDMIEFCGYRIGGPRDINDELRSEAERGKKDGKFRFVSVITHQQIPQIITAAARSGFVDAVMFGYGPTISAPIDKVLPQARQAKLGLIGMKVGAKDVPTAVAVKSALLSIDTVCHAMRSFQELDEYCGYIGRKASRRDIGELDRYVAASTKDACILCGRCTASCPRGIETCYIQLIHRYYLLERGLADVARNVYAQIPADKRAEVCDDCGRCEENCPEERDIRANLRVARQALA